MGKLFIKEERIKGVDWEEWRRMNESKWIIWSIVR